MNILEFDSELLLVNYSIYGDLKGVKRLIDTGTNCNTPSKSSFPLYEAAAKGHIDVVEYLLSLDDIIVNRIDNDTAYAPIHAALFYSFYSNNPAMFKLFLSSSKVDLLIASRASITFGFTPLHLAAYINYSVGVEMLLDIGVDPYIKTENGLSFLDVAGRSNSCRERTEYVRSKLEQLITLSSLNSAQE